MEPTAEPIIESDRAVPIFCALRPLFVPNVGMCCEKTTKPVKHTINSKSR